MHQFSICSDNGTYVLEPHFTCDTTKVTRVRGKDLAKDIDSMAEIIENLQRQNNLLISQNSDLFKTVTTLTSQVGELLKSSSTGSSSNKKSFAGIVANSIQTPAAQVSIIRATEIAQHSEERKKSIIVRNACLPEECSKDNELGSCLAKSCGVPTAESIFRIPTKKGPPLLKIKLKKKRRCSQSAVNVRKGEEWIGFLSERYGETRSVEAGTGKVSICLEGSDKAEQRTRR
uniref:Uncharacterized protein n=1 Tax=Caenorhabditis japonica TaxID=281687 RepID=A0A8R1DG88_CAEJA